MAYSRECFYCPVDVYLAFRLIWRFFLDQF